MSNMFLTADEISEMTQRIQYKAQAKQLVALGVEFRIRADGSLLVLRAHVERLLGGASEQTKEVPYEPNWAAASAPHPPRKK
jgi:hypothetical protein